MGLARSIADTEVGRTYGKMTPFPKAQTEEKTQQRALAVRHCNEGNTGSNFCLLTLAKLRSEVNVFGIIAHVVRR